MAQPIARRSRSYEDPAATGLDDDLLPRAVERDLARRWRDERDYRARDRILLAYRRLANSLARKASRFGLPFDDLSQEAMEGLMHALDRFDPERGFGFGTFARYHVTSKLQEYMLENVAPMRIFNTAATKALLARYHRLRRDAEAESGGAFDEAAKVRLCEELGVDRGQLERFQMAMTPVVSIDGRPDDGSSEQGAAPLQIAAAGTSPEEATIQALVAERRSVLLGAVLDEFPERVQEIIRTRYSEEGCTLESLAARYGVSRERVRQIEIRALLRMREMLRQQGLESADDGVVDP